MLRTTVPGHRSPRRRGGVLALSPHVEVIPRIYGIQSGILRDPSMRGAAKRWLTVPVTALDHNRTAITSGIATSPGCRDLRRVMPKLPGLLLDLRALCAPGVAGVPDAYHRTLLPAPRDFPAMTSMQNSMNIRTFAAR